MNRLPSRRSMVLGGVACLLGVGDWGIPRLTERGHTCSSTQRATVDPRAVNRVDTHAPVLALTFDDGPDPQYTPQVLELLAARRVTATFFMIGLNVQAHPDLVADVVGAGHAIGNHTQHHLWLDDQPPTVIDPEIRDATASLRHAGQDPSTFFRPPRGWTSPQVAACAQLLGVRSVFWSDCLEAHLRAGIVGAADAVARNASPGSIILCHDGGRLAGPNPQNKDRSRTIAALPRMLDEILDKGLTPVRLGELLRHA